MRMDRDEVLPGAREDRLYDSPERGPVEPPARRVWNWISPKSRLQAAWLGAMFVLMLLALLASLLPSPAPEETLVREPAGGLLADVRGDDVLHRLQMTQAALKRELALLREWASKGGELLPPDTDVAYALARQQVGHTELAGLVRQLEAHQMSLETMVVKCQADTQALSEIVQSHLAEEGY